jgi:hypothetical protein
MQFSSAGKLSAAEKVNLIQNKLKIIDNTLFSSFFQNIFYLPFVINAERELISAISDASLEEINYLLPELELGRILYKVKDHRVVRVFSRTKLLRILCTERISDLGVKARAALLHALQVMKLSAHVEAEKFVKHIILRTSDDLSRLKTLMDSKGDVNSMHKLVFEDVRSEEIRAGILQHIQTQADVQQAHLLLGTRVSQHMRLFAWRKILSDVDDTLTCSGGSYPSGIDTSFPKKCLYPGVLMFYRELDLGTAGGDVWDQTRMGNLVFLSARPHVYRDVLEKVSYDKFRRLVQERGMHTVPTLLAGTLEAGGAFMWNNDMEPLAKQKFKNFMEYYRVYPEFNYIFIGDNGQGDVRTAEMMIEALPGRVERVYVHRVQALTKMACKLFTSNQHSLHRFCFFTTYIDAALDAFRHKLIHAQGLRRVAAASVSDIAQIKHWLSPLQREMRLREINASLQKANGELTALSLQPVPPLYFPQVFEVGTEVWTPFGAGVVDHFRPFDGIYELKVLPRSPFWTDPYAPAHFLCMYVTLEQLVAYRQAQPPKAQLPSKLRSLKDIYFALVWTQFGHAVVVSRKLMQHRIVEVEFVRWKLASGRCARGFLLADRLVALHVFKPIPLAIIQRAVIAPHSRPNRAAAFAVRLLEQMRGLSARFSSSRERQQPRPALGTSVQTPYGCGVVMEHRNRDNITRVELVWRLSNNRAVQAYLAPGSILPLGVANTPVVGLQPTYSSLKQRQQRCGRAHGTFQLFAPAWQWRWQWASRPRHTTLRAGRRVVLRPFGVCEVVDAREGGTNISTIHLRKVLGKTTLALQLYVPRENIEQLSPASVGSYVHTPFGTGRVDSIRDDGVHVVQCLCPRMSLYLQPENVLAVIDAAVGCFVDTEYGTGIVTQYRAHIRKGHSDRLRTDTCSGIFEVQLVGRTHARSWGTLFTSGPLHTRHEPVIACARPVRSAPSSPIVQSHRREACYVTKVT